VNTIRDFDIVYFCAGARNHSLLSHFKCQKEFILDERMAAFMALGEAKMGKKVAICTTSGTAVLECLPAICEAFYSGLNLVLISADRPMSLTGTNAPQTINQYDSLSPFTHLQKNITKASDIVFDKGISHFNIHIGESSSESINHELDSFENKNILFLISHDVENCTELFELISKKTDLYYFEILSGLHHKNIIANERELLKLFEAGDIEGIVRIGSTPLSKLWRVIDNKALPVYHFDKRGFKALSYGLVDKNSDIYTKIEKLKVNNVKLEKTNELNELLNKYPSSQCSFISQLARMLPENSHLYLGNSSLIRDFEIAFDKSASFYGNRGANGIDGQIASSIGIAKNLKSDLYVCLGDLTFEYDISSLRYLLPNMKILIFNNGGGRIFERIGINDEIIMAHERNYQGHAQVESLSYAQYNDLNFELNCSIIELKINAQESLELFQEL